METELAIGHQLSPSNQRTVKIEKNPKYQSLIKEIKNRLYAIKIASLKETPIKPEVKLISDTQPKYGYSPAIQPPAFKRQTFLMDNSSRKNQADLKFETESIESRSNGPSLLNFRQQWNNM